MSTALATARPSALATSPLEVIRLIDDLDGLHRHSPVVVARVFDQVAWIRRIREAEWKNRLAIVKAAAAHFNTTIGTIYRWRNSFDADNWRGLIDERKAGARGLPPLFVSHLHGVWDAHHRDNDDGAEVHRVLLDQWNLWRTTHAPEHAIPGYGSPPPADPATGHPAGWSARNFRKHRPRKHELALAKHGQKAAADFLPHILTTRVGSAVLSRLLFDDQDYDNMLTSGQLVLAGLPAMARPVSFNCLDFYTARHMANHLRLIRRDADRDRTLTGKEFNWFLVEILMGVGYRTDSLGTELILEHGTANSWGNKELRTLNGFASFDAAIEALSAGCVRPQRGGKFEGPLFAGLCFAAQSTGNFRYKTWIESAFRMLRITMQALPVPIGSHARVNKREEIYGIQKAEEQIGRVIRECPDAALREFILENVRHEGMDVPTFGHLVAAIYRAVNMTSEHRLEGWRQCGFTVPLWRLRPDSETWFAMSELQTLYPDPEERSLIMRKINSDERLTKVELMSREAAYAISMSADRHLIRRLQPQFIGHLLPTGWADEVTVSANHQFTLANPLWEDSRETYVASWDESGRRVTLDHGQKLLVYHNPFSAGRAIIYSLNGHFITQLFPTVRAAPFDAAAKLDQLKRRSAVKSGHEAGIRARMEGIAAARTEDRKFNRELMLPAIPLTRDDRRRANTARETAAAETSASASRTAAGDADRALANIHSFESEIHTDDLGF
jgi:hypothetical protein